MYGVVSLPCDGGPSGSYGDTSQWYRLYWLVEYSGKWGIVDTSLYRQNPPTAADINAADVRNNFAARMGVPRVLTGNNAPTSAGVWSVENSSWAGTTWGSLICTTNSSDLSTTPATRSFYITCKLRMKLAARPVCVLLLMLTGRSAGGIAFILPAISQQLLMWVLFLRLATQ